VGERFAKSFELQFRDADQWRPIPQWARFFISLGAALSSAHSPQRRIVVALSVPTSSFAAAFIALGRVLGEPISEPAKRAVDDHFDRLAALVPRRTWLIYFDGKALYSGPFLGTLKLRGDDWIQMADPRKKCTLTIPKQGCLLVDVQGENPTDKPVRLKNPKPFVRNFFNLIEHYKILCSTTKSVIVIGEKNRLRHELVQTPFAVPSGTSPVDGVLQDLIRIAKFSSIGLGYRADVYASSRGRAVQKGASEAEGSLIILDGAASHCRWAHEYSHYDSVSILSRTESEYGTAVDLANARYLSRLDDCLLPGLLDPPAGIELMAHLEPRQ
jgi:hypothetical protein